MQLVVFVRAREADPEHVLVGAHLGNNRAVGGKPDLDEGAVLIAVHRELVRAVDGCKALAVRVGAEDAQKEHRARADGFQRAHVALQLPATDFGSRVHPEVHLRQVEFAGAACNALARADDLQPLVFTHALRRASGSLIIVTFPCFILIKVSVLHFGQNKGKFISSVSSRTLVRVLLLQIGHNTHNCLSIAPPYSFKKFNFCFFVVI